MNMKKEDMMFQKHLQDLADQAWNRDIPVFTDFLDLNEQNMYHSIESRLNHIHCRLFGGYEYAERQMLGFLPDAFCFDKAAEEAVFPLIALKVRPTDHKFSDPPSHRDYLGSLMHIGIERKLLGDILVEGHEATVFCSASMAEYISKNLLTVRRSVVQISEIPCTDIHFEPKIETSTCSISSVRLDALITAAFTGSRSTLSSLIGSGQVYVNGRQILKASYEPAEGAMITVRGEGRFRYNGVIHETKKGRLMISLDKYM